MHGVFAVLKNSHYAVTGEGGKFSLPNLPPGKHTIAAYHESYGEQSQEVTITGSETKTVNFVFQAKPQGRAHDSLTCLLAPRSIRLNVPVYPPLLRDRAT
jgi:hypothetical protein